MKSTLEEWMDGRALVNDGVVHLFPETWDEFEPFFAAAGITLRQHMPVSEFSGALRRAHQAGTFPQKKAVPLRASGESEELN